MDPETRKQKEDALEQLRSAADAAHQAAADGDEAKIKLADEAEEKYNEAKTELDATPLAEPSDDGEEEEGKDIDFEKELKDLEGDGAPAPKPYRTELEKAERALHFTAQRVKELGGDPTKVVKPAVPVDPPAPPAPKGQDDDRYATKDDIARQEAAKLGRTDAERKVIMYHYENSIKKTGDIQKDVDNAYFIANKGRIRRSIDEIRRAGQVRVPQGGGPGKPPQPGAKVPTLSSGDQAALKRRGFQPQADGTWKAKKYQMRFVTGKGWVTEKLK